jgi:hypothetical protein
MLKWFKITKNQYFGLFLLGFALFALQELPYMIMPLIPLKTNVLMDMEDKIAVLNALEKTAGIACVIIMLFLVRADTKGFSLETRAEKISFAFAAAALGAYFVGWIFYFCGYQGRALILALLVAMPPIYYSFIGLWRKNYVLAIAGVLFLAIHVTNVSFNLV